VPVYEQRSGDLSDPGCYGQLSRGYGGVQSAIGRDVPGGDDYGDVYGYGRVEQHNGVHVPGDGCEPVCGGRLERGERGVGEREHGRLPVLLQRSDGSYGDLGDVVCKRLRGDDHGHDKQSKRADLDRRFGQQGERVDKNRGYDAVLLHGQEAD